MRAEQSAIRAERRRFRERAQAAPFIRSIFYAWRRIFGLSGKY
jgi:hypothetical protein